MITRREYLAASSAALLAASAPGAAVAQDGKPFDPSAPLPHKDAFFPFKDTYLNSASQHPLSRGARKAVNKYLDFKTFALDSDFSNFNAYDGALAKFAQLINASQDEVCFVQSTTVGENLVFRGLGFPHSGGRIVTDELHYTGSSPSYDQLAKEGVDVHTIRSDNGVITAEQFAEAITPDTRLVAFSSVSMINGFEHDLAEICEIAHANGALVYADLVQQVGSMPVDVRASGVDFCAAASYKWLLGEQGLGFLYARKDRLADIDRPWYGHYQLKSRQSFAFPAPEPGDVLTEYEHLDSALGYFAMGSQSNIVAAILNHSLDYVLETGVERIQQHRQPLIDRLQEELPQLGFEPLTPRNSKTALVSFRHALDADDTRNKLGNAGIIATAGQYHVRFSPSVFNDMDDIEKVLKALA